MVTIYSTEQDRGLDAISDALRRQQRIGFAIQDEVVEHNGKYSHCLVRPPLCGAGSMFAIQVHSHWSLNHDLYTKYILIGHLLT